MFCTKCGNELSGESKFCDSCGQAFYSTSIGILPKKVNIKNGKAKVLMWFFLTNLSVVISIAVISGGAMLDFAPYLLLFGSTFPFIGLFMSKWLIKKAHKIYIVNPDNFQSEKEKLLYKIIDELSKASGISKLPEIGIYSSLDQNAFATGWSKDKALIAFSTGLLSTLDENELYAVAAHETAHIVNGDMLTMTIIQSVINTFVLLVTLPFNILKIFALFSDEIGAFGYGVISLIKVLVSGVAMFLGSLVVKAFSRHREFMADKLASNMIGKEHMISALQKLNSVDKEHIPKEQYAYAALKINSTESIFDIFSTHPSIERRVERLKNM